MSKVELQTTITDLGRILSSVSHEDALWIFHEARDGIFNSSRTIDELELTQKRYYTKLKDLLDAGLIEKSGRAYKHTMFGSACYRLGEILIKVLNNRERLDLLTRLKAAETLSTNEKREIAQALSIDEKLGISDLLQPVTVIDDFEDLVQKTVALIERAEGEVYFATQYFDVRVIEAILEDTKRGINFSFLYKMADSNYERIRMMMKMAFSSPKVFKFFYKWVNSPDLNIRFVDVPYTFIVVDRKYALVELLKPFADDFSLAFIFEHPSLCSQLLETFSSLWDKGSKAKSVIESLTKVDELIIQALKR